MPSKDKKIKAEAYDGPAFQERGRVEGVWHLLEKWEASKEWQSVCGSFLAADHNNYRHMLTSQRGKVNCPECIKIMEKDAQ